MSAATALRRGAAAIPSLGARQELGTLADRLLSCASAGPSHAEPIKNLVSICVRGWARGLGSGGCIGRGRAGASGLLARARGAVPGGWAGGSAGGVAVDRRGRTALPSFARQLVRGLSSKPPRKGWEKFYPKGKPQRSKGNQSK
eukprot:evm.model.scf_555EXC.7 EVM.evm.TU.scf_555EXC.7   scf_555EXC:55302-56905(-)